MIVSLPAFQGFHKPASAGGGGGGTPGVATTTLFFLDGVQHNAAANDKWTADDSPAIASGITGALGRVYDNATLRQSLNLPNLASASVRVRFKLRSLADDNLIRFMDTSSTNQLVFQVMSTGGFRVGRGNTPTILKTSTSTPLNTTDWFWAEFAATINDTTGAFTARVYDASGTLLESISDTNVDTQQTSNAFTTRVNIGATTADSYTEQFSVDSTGQLYGPLRIETLYPNGAGSAANWNRSGTDSGANWSQCAEAQNDDSAQFVRTDVDNSPDLYSFQDRSLSGAIYAVQVTPVATREAAVGGIQFRPLLRVGSTNYAGDTKTLTSSFIAHPHCWGTNPDTSAAWASNEPNSVEAGMERVAGSAGVDVFVTQIVIEIASAL